MKELTQEQKIVISGFTGVLCCDFGDLHEDIEKRVGGPVFTHEFAMKGFGDKLKEMYRDDFMQIIGKAGEQSK